MSTVEQRRWPTLLRSRTRQQMTNELALFVHWSARQKLNRISSVQLRRSVRAFTVTIPSLYYIALLTADADVAGL